MNIWHLRYFYEAAKKQSIKAAAEKFLVSSSAVSQAIKSLESEFSISFLIHKKRLFELTPAGHKFMNRIPALINEMELLADDLNQLLNEPEGIVSIGIPRSLLTLKFTQALLHIQKKHPKLKFKIKGGITSEIKQWVLDREVNFGFVVDDDNLSNFDTEEFMSGSFLLVAKAKIKLTHESDLIVTNQDKVEVKHLIREWKKAFQSQPKIDFEIASWGVIADLVSKSNYVGYVPDYVVLESIEKERVHAISSKLKPYQYSAKVIWPKNKSKPQALDLILHHITN